MPPSVALPNNIGSWPRSYLLMSQTDPKYRRLEALLSQVKPAAPDPNPQSPSDDVGALKARVAELEAKLAQQLPAATPEITTSTIEPKTQPLPAKSSQEMPASAAQESASNAFRITLIGLPASIIAASFYLYLALTIGAWQLYAWSADIWLLAFVVLIGMILIRRKLVSQGIWLLLIAIQVTFIGAVGLIQGIGLLVGASIAILVSIIAGQTLSEKAASRASILGVVSGVAAILLDLFGPAFRLPQPAPIRVFLPGILGVVILLYGYVTVRQFRNYSLRTKLLLGFLGVLILSSLVGVFSVQQQFRSAEQTTVTEASNVADVVSGVVARNQVELQELVIQLHESQQRDVEVVGPDLRILADAVPEGVGTIFEGDQNGEVAATLKDGQPRTFVEISADYPQGVKQVVVPARDESGKIIAATILDYTPLYTELQQTVNTAVRTLVFLGLAMLLVAFVISQFISASIVNPISQLRDVALKIGGGQLDTPVPALSSKDEVGILAVTFKNMTAQLRGLIGSLEQRVTERTHDLELASEVGRAVSEKSADIYGLLKDAVELIRERFNLYYTQIYLADPAGRTLILRAGTGEVGAELLRRGHHLAIGAGSLNGRAAAEKRAVIVTDTKDSPSFLPNPLLPATRSEMAIPLIAGGRVVGVLDMQSERPGALSETNLPAFEALAGQLAIALQNAALFAEAQEARSEVEAQVHRLTEQGWQDFMNAIERGQKMGFAFDQTSVVPLKEEGLAPLPVESALSVPITMTNANIGAIQIANQSDRAWTSGEVEILQAIAAQLARHIESLRLLGQTERYRAQAEEAVRRLTREGWETLQASGEIAPGYVYDLNEVKLLSEGGNASASTALKKPLVVRDETIGELAANVEASSDEAAEILAAVAEQLSGHIENLRLFEQTERALVQTEQLSHQNELILGTAGEGIFGLDEKGNHTFVNPAAAEMLGYTTDELIGRHSHTTWHHSHPDGSHYPAEECPIYHTLRTGTANRGDEYFWRKDGTGFPVAFTSTPVTEGDRVVGK